MTKLKPCPFCGKQPERDMVDMVYVQKWWVHCENERCSVQPSTPMYVTKGADVRAWNRRARG